MGENSPVSVSGNLQVMVCPQLFSARLASKPVYTYNFYGYLPEGLVRIREKLNEITEFTRMLNETSACRELVT